MTRQNGRSVADPLIVFALLAHVAFYGEPIHDSWAGSRVATEQKPVGKRSLARFSPYGGAGAKGWPADACAWAIPIERGGTRSAASNDRIVAEGIVRDQPAESLSTGGG